MLESILSCGCSTPLEGLQPLSTELDEFQKEYGSGSRNAKRAGSLLLPAAARPAHSRCGMLPAACRGEHGSWSKSTNFELDVRTPLIIRAPWISESVGKTTLALAELVDLFPTAVALAGLPPVSAAEGLEGTSLVPVLKDPGNEGGVKIAAYSQYPRCPQYDQLHCKNEEWECLQVPNVNITRMGQSLGHTGHAGQRDSDFV